MNPLLLLSTEYQEILFVKLFVVNWEAQRHSTCCGEPHGHGQDEIPVPVPCGRMRSFNSHVKTGKPGNCLRPDGAPHLPKGDVSGWIAVKKFDMAFKIRFITFGPVTGPLGIFRGKDKVAVGVINGDHPFGSHDPDFEAVNRSRPYRGKGPADRAHDLVRG